MPTIIFSHPDVSRGDLKISTGVSSMDWGYRLNTQSYPTYGGEVVQVLSCYIDNIKLNGQCRSYASMEAIYEWFLAYIQIATQGIAEDPVSGQFYNEKPVTMTYPERGWVLEIKPINLPAFRYGLEVIVPEWSLEAAVVTSPQELRDFSMEKAVQNVRKGSNSILENLNAGIGFEERWRFSDPNAFPDKSAKSKKDSKLTPQEYLDKAQAQAEKLGDFYKRYISDYENMDFHSIFSGHPETAEVSKPTPASPKAPQKNKQAKPFKRRGSH